MSSEAAATDSRKITARNLLEMWRTSENFARVLKDKMALTLLLAGPGPDYTEATNMAARAQQHANEVRQTILELMGVDD